MKLLDEIIEIAADGKTSPAVLLRKLLVVAFRLQSEKLKVWIEKELNGYGPNDPLPDYRKTSTHSTGVFFGGGGSSMSNVPLPTLLLKEEHRKLVDTAELREGVAAYQVPPGNEPQLGQWQIPWSPNLVTYYQSVFYPGQYALKAAWQEVPSSVVSMLLDAVQSRTLMLALEVQAELGPNGEDLSAVRSPNLDRSIVNIIYGGNNLIGAQTGDVHQAGSIVVNKGDFVSLSAALEELGINKSDVADLKTAVAKDTEEHPSEGIGKRAKAWVIDAAVKLTGSIGDAGFELAKDEAIKQLTSLVGRYVTGA